VAEQYGFDNAWEQARHRLTLLEALYDHITIRSLSSTPSGPCWPTRRSGSPAGA